MTDTPRIPSDRASIGEGEAKHIWQRMYFIYNFRKRKHRFQKEAPMTCTWEESEAPTLRGESQLLQLHERYIKDV